MKWNINKALENLNNPNITNETPSKEEMLDGKRRVGEQLREELASSEKSHKRLLEKNMDTLDPFEIKAKEHIPVGIESTKKKIKQNIQEIHFIENYYDKVKGQKDNREN